MRIIDKIALERVVAKVGLMSSEEALAIAIDAESMALDCGRDDIAYIGLDQQARNFERYAYLLELAGH